MNRIEKSYRADLSPVLLDINKNKFLKGKGMWNLTTPYQLTKDISK